MVRWGFLGAGNVASDFISALKNVPNARLAGVAARSAASAQAFAQRHGVAVAHESYDALVADPNIDLVYVGVVHTGHFENTMRCLRAGKGVVVEKPMGMNAREVQAMVELARANNLFLMEGMWTRFLPSTRFARSLIGKPTNEGGLGQPLSLEADFGISVGRDSVRMYDPALGGGALLDVGCYPVSIASHLLGMGKPPTAVHAVGRRSPEGVDLFGAALLQFGDPATDARVASVSWSMVNETFENTTVHCEGGIVRLCSPGHCSGRVEVVRFESRGVPVREEKEFPMPEVRNAEGERVAPSAVFNFPNSEAFEYQQREVQECFERGEKECSLMPLDESVEIAKALDAIRAQLGIRYAADEQQ